jgi:hypothetical protein
MEGVFYIIGITIISSAIIASPFLYQSDTPKKTINFINLTKLDYLDFVSNYAAFSKYDNFEDAKLYIAKYILNNNLAESIINYSATPEEFKDFLYKVYLQRRNAKRTAAAQYNQIKGKFGGIEHHKADTELYYIALPNGHYKVGIASDFNKRYTKGALKGCRVLYRKRLINAMAVEAAIKQTYKHAIAHNDGYLGTKGTEVFKYDVLKLDV